MPNYRYQFTAVLEGNKESLPGLSGTTVRGITVTATYPVVCSKPNHGFEEDDVVYAEGFGQATYLNGRIYTVDSVTTNDFTLAGVDGTSEVPDTIGGTLKKAFVEVESDEELSFNNRIKLAWGAVRGALFYRVYRYHNGAFLRLTDTTELTYEDEGLIPNSLLLPPNATNVAMEGNPAVATYYQQRRIFAGGSAEASSWAASEVNDQDAFSYAGIITAAAPFKVTLAAAEAIGIRHLIPGRDLVVLTGSAEWVVSAGQGGFTVTSINQRPQSEIGASNIRPLYSHGRTIFERRNGGGLYELQYSFDSDGYNAIELSLFAQHLFRGNKIRAMAQAFSPHNRIVCVMEDGTANVLAYYPQQEVVAWSTWDTNGVIEDVASIPNNDTGEDELYFTVSRSLDISGTEYFTRTIEKLDSRNFNDENDAYFVDSGLSYSGSAVSAVGGLYHLRGRKDVVALADGRVEKNLTVSDKGEVSLGSPAKSIHVGLPYAMWVRTLAVETPGQTSIQEMPKKVTSIGMKIYRSRGYEIGLANEPTVEQKAQVANPTGLFTGLERVSIPTAWKRELVFDIFQPNPLPFSLQGIIPRMMVSKKSKGQ